MKSVPRLLYPPAFADSNQTRAAGLLHYILLATILANLASMFIDLVIVGQPLWWAVLNLAILALQIGALILNYSGRVKLGAVLVCGFFWVAVTLSAYTVNGIFNSLFGVYTVVIVIAALLINTWAAVAVTGLSLLAGFYFVSASSQGIYPDQVGLMSASETFTNYAIGFVLTTLLLTLAMRALNNALLRAETNERALRQSESKYRSVVQNAPMPILTVDLNHNITFLSHSKYGDPKQHYGKPIYDFTQPEWRPALREKVEAVLQTGEPATVELGVINITGSFSWYVDYIAPIWDENKIIGATIIALDISEQKQAEQTRLESERLRLEINKERDVLELKERFISTLSHDFRTPLAIILSAKESLQFYYDRLTPERRLEHLQNIDHGVSYINTLLDDVLTIGKARAGKLGFNPESLDLLAFCTQVMSQMQAIDKDNHQFVLLSSENLSKVSADPQLLHHILMNLFNNAAKYSPKNTRIQLKLEREDTGVLLEVSDQGIGIPLSEQSHLFEPFFRATNARKIKGTGLGLAIIKESVVAHGGTIECISGEGTGTTFTIRLPLQTELSPNVVSVPQTVSS